MNWQAGLAYLALVFFGAIGITAVLISVTSKGRGPE